MSFKTVLSKGASGSTTAAVTFSADSGGRWEVGFIRVKSDLSSSVLTFTQGTTVVGTTTIGAATVTLNGSGENYPVFAGTNEAALVLTISGTSACEIIATAGLNEAGAS